MGWFLVGVVVTILVSFGFMAHLMWKNYTGS